MRVAVLFGWIASQHRAVTKYANVYSNKGYETICVALPSLVAWVPFLAKRSAGGVVNELDRLSSLARQRSPDSDVDVVFHWFSLSASAFSPTILAAMERPSRAWRLRAMIHDSGPVQFNVASGVAAANQLVKQGGMNRTIARLAVLAGTAADGLFGDLHRANLSCMLTSPHTAVPQLFLYSRNDSVLDWREAEQRISEQKQRGVPVTSHRWQNSEHVKHFVEHKEEYRSIVGEFLDKHIT